MKKAFIILLCALAVFAIVSCKEEPAPAKAKNPVVTFDTQEGSAIAPVTVEKGVAVEKPENPTRDGFSFYKWFTESTLENEYNFETPVTESITLFAKWVKLPAAETQTIKSVSPSDIVKLTATAASDGFQLQWLFDEEVQDGDILSFKYKATVTVGKATIRKMTGDKASTVKFESSYALNQTEDEWQTFTYTIPEGQAAAGVIGIGVRLEPAEGKNAIGDVIYIKEITYKTSTETKRLSIAEENKYWGVEPTIAREYIRLVATQGGNLTNDYDKFSLYWNPNVTVNPGDVFSITFKPLRNSPLTTGRDFTYSIRDAKKWFSEQKKGDASSVYPKFWSTFSEPDEDGWITATYTFPAANAETTQPITYPATFRVDFRDNVFASPNEGYEADILYIRNMTITSGGVTTNLVLNAEKTSTVYGKPTVETYYAPAPAAE